MGSTDALVGAGFFAGRNEFRAEAKLTQTGMSMLLEDLRGRTGIV
jgi:hypothetical protein